MKKIKFEKKLSLNKETIANLNNDQLSTIKGGVTNSNGCPTYNCPTTKTWTIASRCGECGPATTGTLICE